MDGFMSWLGDMLDWDKRAQHSTTLTMQQKADATVSRFECLDGYCAGCQYWHREWKRGEHGSEEIMAWGRCMAGVKIGGLGTLNYANAGCKQWVRCMPGRKNIFAIPEQDRAFAYILQHALGRRVVTRDSLDGMGEILTRGTVDHILYSGVGHDETLVIAVKQDDGIIKIHQTRHTNNWQVFPTRFGWHRELGFEDGVSMYNFIAHGSEWWAFDLSAKEAGLELEGDELP